MIKDGEPLVSSYYRSLIDLLGFDIENPNFIGTPERVARMWSTFTTPKQYQLTDFPLQQKGGMILVKNHECWSFCPHHLLPVKYLCKMAYVPESKVLGLSKLAWIADDLMRLMPLQEELPSLIGKRIQEAIMPKGVGVIIQGEHLCMRMRGVESSHAEAVSSFVSGCFLTDQSCREEFMML